MRVCLQGKVLEPHELLMSLRMDLDRSMAASGDVQPAMARRLLGPRWRLTRDKLSNSSDTTGKTLLTLTEYKKRLNIA